MAEEIRVLWIRGLQPLGRSPLVGCELFSTRPRKQRASVHVTCSNGAACACRIIPSPPLLRSAKPERLGDSALNNISTNLYHLGQLCSYWYYSCVGITPLLQYSGCSPGCLKSRSFFLRASKKAIVTVHCWVARWWYQGTWCLFRHAY